MSENNDNRLDKIFRQFFQNWAMLETTLMMYFGKLVLTDQIRAQIIWEGLPNFQSRENLLRKLATTYLADEEKDEVLRQLGRVREIVKIRNLFAHTFFGFHPENKDVVAFHKAGAKFKKNSVDFLHSQKIEMKEIESLLEEVYEISLFFGSRGNHTTPLNQLQIDLESKWHREFRDP